MKNLTTNNYWKSDSFNSLVEDCQATLVEGFFNSHWILVEAYHQVGKRIREEQTTAPISELLHNLAERTTLSERKFWYAVQLYDKYPKTDLLPEGKAITMNKLITKYLPKHPKDEEKLHEDGAVTCPRCGFSWKAA